MHTKVVTFATVVCLMGMMGMMASAHAAPPPRGAANTQERATYCGYLEAGCIDKGQDGCLEKFGGGSVNYYVCMDGVNLACSNSFGSTSDCMTAERTTGPAPLFRKPPPLIQRRGVEEEPPASPSKGEEGETPAPK